MGTVFTAPLQRIQNYVAPNFFFFFLKIKRASSSNTSLEMRTSLAFIAIIAAFIGISVSLECWGRDYPEKPCKDKSLTPKVDLSMCVKKKCSGIGPNSKPTCQRMRFKTKYGTKTTVSLLGCGVPDEEIGCKTDYSYGTSVVCICGTDLCNAEDQHSDVYNKYSKKNQNDYDSKKNQNDYYNKFGAKNQNNDENGADAFIVGPSVCFIV